MNGSGTGPCYNVCLRLRPFYPAFPSSPFSLNLLTAGVEQHILLDSQCSRKHITTPRHRNIKTTRYQNVTTSRHYNITKLAYQVR
nr:hypothetical protein BgiMline_002742 [Biomphalaria glabrata]